MGRNVLRFGEMALKMKLLSVDELEEGLQMQDSARRAGLPVPSRTRPPAITMSYSGSCAGTAALSVQRSFS